jgi:sulfur-carrier protein
MTVSVAIPTALRRFAGGASIESLDGATVGEVLDALFAKHPPIADQLMADGKLRSFVNVYVGDEDIRHLDGVDTKVDDGTQISIIPAIAGGGVG